MSHSDEREQTWIRAAAGGDDRAFEQIVRAHRDAVFSYIVRLGDCDPATADDLAQEVFVTAWKKLAEFRGDAALRTWLFSIAHNRVRTWRRSLARQFYRRLWQEPDKNRIGEPGQEPDIEFVERAVRRLPPKFREPLYLYVFEGLDYESVARVTGVPLGTVKSRIHTARERLARQIQAHQAVAPPAAAET